MRSPFRVSIIEAAFELVRYCAKSEAVTPASAASELGFGPSDVSCLDYSSVLSTIDAYGAGIFSTSSEHTRFYRESLQRLITTIKPPWAEFIPHGRKKVSGLLGPNERQCFENAGLVGADLDQEGFTWWDELDAHFRQLQDQELRALGRRGELWSLEFEQLRLRRLGSAKRPIWIALEDNSVGYDILSYDVCDTQEVERLVEVKTTTFLPATFYLSRNEWEVAMSNRDRYVLHLWTAFDRSLRELSVGDLQEFVPTDRAPTDRGVGKWQSVKVRVTALPTAA